MSTPILQYFTYKHLPYGPMQTASAHCATLAKVIDDLVPDGPEKSAGLRKLLEAKDCFVRAAMPEESDPDSPDNQEHKQDYTTRP